MSDAPRARRTRFRRACEPCRKKKAKCPGERPECSFCQRLRQPCNYQSRTRVAQASQGHPGQGEQPESPTTRTLPGKTRPSTRSHATLTQHGDNDEQLALEASSGPSLTRSLSRAEIEILVDTYREKIHGQPLVLFEPTRLGSTLGTWPPELYLGLLAICERFSHDRVTEAADNASTNIHQRRQTARLYILKRVAINDRSLVTLQALCLVILGHIYEGDHLAASIDIGICGKLLVASLAGAGNTPNDDLRRCLWSVYMLDRLYGSSQTISLPIPPDILIRQYPLRQQGGDHNQISQSPGPLDEISIAECCVQLFAAWSPIATFLHAVRSDEHLCLWSQSSPYHLVLRELYTYDTEAAPTHMMKNVRFHEQTPSALRSKRSYWVLWITMQFHYHAIQIVINHPFFHISRRRLDKPRHPVAFLQQTVDQALLHSRWIINFITLCDKKEFEINDPFLAHLASIAGTAYLFFSQAKESYISQQSRDNFDICVTFIEKISATWPRLQVMVSSLMFHKSHLSCGCAYLLWSRYVSSRCSGRLLA
ncbi:hypothetical protein BX600DRAFT_54466 [Xylariales sp. PMI_506]|nr:hypothetical protein BX600DRAFT_54466 [Xylariales sp. PMI_506]